MICIGNHTHSSPIWEIIVLAILKIVRGYYIDVTHIQDVAAIQYMNKLANIRYIHICSSKGIISPERYYSPILHVSKQYIYKGICKCRTVY